MLSRHNPKTIEAALRAANPPPPFPSARDRAAWRRVRDDVGDELVADIIQAAEEELTTPIPPLPASLYLRLARTGSRDEYEAPLFQRRARLGILTLAECLEGEGRFLDPVLDIVWATCEESSWVLPAHQRVLADPGRPQVDLGSAMTAMALADVDAIVGDLLDPAVGVRIRHEVNVRCLEPFLSRHDFHWLFAAPDRTANNWTAVCSGGIGAAAIHLEPDPARLAEILARVVWSMDDYLASFGPDGGSSEGPGYWSYGFGYYVMFAHLVEHRTDGDINLLDDEPERERIRGIAQDPLRTVLSPGRWVNFSDCVPDVAPIPALVHFLAQRLDIPDLARITRGESEMLVRGETQWQLRRLFWRARHDEPFVPARHDWIAGLDWMIARRDPSDPDALVLAAKGGHNDENHNQNDVGNIIVHVKRESVIADPGAGRYTAEYFGPTRYEHFVNSSRGHSVPVVNGLFQGTGAEHGATVLERRNDDRADVLALELRDAYPAEADLASLRRTITLHRDVPAGAVTLEDRARFATGPGRLESVLITFGRVEIGPGAVQLRGERGSLRVAFDAGTVDVRHEIERDVPFKVGERDVQRVVFALREPAPEATIALRIEPV